ncbi:hypothetical protein Leryth_021107 [Lithospermum erythrorhizon]|nr:hypothetical protein Leryth_021107 [Lithospermum erythrorhizon]
MEVESQQHSSWEGYVDCRNRPATKSRHGGMAAASFVLVTNFMGTAFLLALLGGGFILMLLFTTFVILTCCLLNSKNYLLF